MKTLQYNKNILKFVGFIFVAFFIAFYIPKPVYAQTNVIPSMTCLGSCPTPTGNAPTASQAQPTSANNGMPNNQGASAQPSSANPPAANAPCKSVANSANATSETMHRRRPGGRGGRGGGSQGLLQLLLQLLQQLMQLIQQLTGGGGSSGGGGGVINTPIPNPTVGGGGGGVTPAATLPPCPSVTPAAQPTIGQQIVTPAVSSNPSTAPSQAATPVVSVALSTAPTPPGANPTGQTVAPPTKNGNNYSGYFFHTAAPAVGDTITTTWTAVKLDCSKNTGTGAPFPGMGDTWDVEKTLSQLGTDLKCNGGTASYTAWTEALPAGMVVLQNSPVKEGDQISATITYQGSGKFSTNIKNITAGWSVDTPMTFSSSYVPVGSEVIVEECDGTTIPFYSPLTLTSTFNLGGQQAQMATQKDLTRLNITNRVSTGDLTGSTFTSTRIGN